MIQLRRSIQISPTFFFGALLSMMSVAADARLSVGDLEAMQLLVTGPKDNEVKFCVDSSLEILEGLTALVRTPQNEVVKMLTTGNMGASQRQMREQQARMWESERSPHKLANFQYGWCMAEHGHPTLALGDLGEHCFKVAAIPAYASLLQKANMRKENAIEEVSKVWRNQASISWLRQVVEEIYAAEDSEKRRKVFRQAFLGCLVSSN